MTTRSFVPSTDRSVMLAAADELRRQVPETRQAGVGARERVSEMGIERGKEAEHERS